MAVTEFPFNVYVQLPSKSSYGNLNAMEGMLLHYVPANTFHVVRRGAMRVLVKTAFGNMWEALSESAKKVPEMVFLKSQVESGDFTLLYWKFDIVRGLTMHLADNSWQQPISCEILTRAIENNLF